MAENYVLLERTELNADAASVTFANIPQSGYTDLKIVFSARVNTTNDLFILGFNGSTSGYSNRWIYGNGSSASSGNNGSYTQLISWVDTSDNTASTFGNAEVYIPNYTSSNYKSYSADFVTENNATGAEAGFMASLWSNTAAITSIKFESIIGSNLLAGSTFSLYGIAALGTTPAIAPKADGGNVIDYDGTYWIHTFTSSGTFTPQTGLTCEYVVVAGGGGGGYGASGGGGAGGYRCSVSGESSGGGASAESTLTLTPSTNYTVTIGAGGAAGTSGSPVNGGNNSVFSTITSTAGGGGGSNYSSINDNPTTGGSGGGGAMITGQTGANGTTNQGRAGGNGLGTGNQGSGGGGGASTAGAAGTSGQGGAGGTGVSSSITGSSVQRAGGGGGAGGGGAGVGGAATGGGGGGANGSSPTTFASPGVKDAVVNTGGGGGGGFGSGGFPVGNGGSGIVIIRYPAA
jgi:hypothetical protein